MINQSESIQEHTIVEDQIQREAHSLVKGHEFLTGEQLAQAAFTRLGELKALYRQHLGFNAPE